MMGSFEDLAVSDWTGYGALRFTVHNPGRATAGLGLEIQDDHQGFDDRHQHSFGAPPGDHVIELDFSGGLWRGEENRPYRGEVKGPIDVARVTRLAFVNRGDGPIYVDRVELVKVPPLATPGGFAFDFGRSGKQVMGQTTGVFETTAYTPALGFGLLGPAGSLPRAMSYPTPLLGDGLAWDRGGFRVDLPGGAYLGWIAFERGGFMEGEQCGYAHAEVHVNGAVVTGHDFSPAAPHFLFEDVEITDLGQIEDRLVRPAHAITRFHFAAAAGANVFTVAVTGATDTPLRVAGLLVAPDTPAGAAFLDAHEQRQRLAIAASYPPEDRSRRGPGRSPPARALVAEPLAPGAPVYPRDLPEKPEGLDPPSSSRSPARPRPSSSRSMRRPITRSTPRSPRSPVRGARRSRRRTCSTVGTCPCARSGTARCGSRSTISGPTRTSTSAPAATRAVVLAWRVPAGTAPGLYTGSVVFTAGDVRLAIPLRVRVFAVDLPPLPIPVGLFMNALPFGPNAVGEARFWELQAALLDEQARAGLTSVSGGAGLDFDVQRGADGIVFAGDRALRYLEMARARGLGQAAVTYGGFVSLKGLDVDPRAFAAAFAPFAAAHALPPFYFSLYDEPGTRDELRAALAAVRPFTEAGLRTMGFTHRRKDDALFEELALATYAPVLQGHQPADVADLARGGRHPWIYSDGLDRYGMGLHLWRNLHAGVEGRLEWIGLITQGFAYDNLDGREPSAVAFMIHDRLGLLPTPRWLAAREGLLDLRIRLALEKAVPAGDPALGSWSMDGYGHDRDRWNDDALEASRRQMLERIGSAAGH